MKVSKLLSIPIAIIAVLTMTVPAIAASVTTVGTGAIVGGGGNPPSICAKFETPDDLTAPGTQFNPTPNVDRPMKFYVIADDPNGINDLYGIDVAVFYPTFAGPMSGQEKFNAQAQRTGDTTWVPTNAATAVRILKYGEASDWVDMDADGVMDPEDIGIIPALQSMQAQGRLTLGPGMILGDSNSGVIHDVMNDKQIVVEITAPMDPCQPSLIYRAEISATDLEGNTSPKLLNNFEYLCVVALELDFTSINWGTINVGRENLVTGDNNMGTPAYPTVKNTGNNRAMLSLNATAMTGQLYGKKIKNFDAKMNQLATGDSYGPLAIQHGYIQYNAGVAAIISVLPDVPVVLPPCSTAQIDFSVFPAIPTIQDNYSGQITITILQYSTPVTVPAYTVLPTT